ncbi:MAG: MFS transporter [Clostridia bacterium]|nr:MFS transporter [Clostridia bacterium]
MAILLVIIYITFISLGLPDSLFGVAWPLAHVEFNMPESFASVYSVITALGGGSVSLYAGPLIKKFGTGIVTAVSVVMTAIGLLVIGFAPNLYVMMLGSIISGLGAGAIDTGLNNFVSLHYKAIHMNWLHCFWGVGVTVSPLIMSAFLGDGDWHAGYRTVSYIQFGISIIVFLSLFVWRKYEKREPKQAEVETALPQEEPKISFKSVVSNKALMLSILTLGLYCSVEFNIGTWGASYLINARGLTAEVAARYVSFYFGGIMLGRFLAGIISLKVSDINLMRGGGIIMVLGLCILAIPVNACAMVGLLLIGTGCGPIFPSTLHAVPQRFGKEYSTHFTGYHMGGAYVVGFTMQITLGYVATATTFKIVPYVFLVFTAMMLVVSEVVNKLTCKERTI